MAQVVYHIRAYLVMRSKGYESTDIVVPSGNFGNVLAAHVAKQMGVPIRNLIVATNENKVLDHFFKARDLRANTSSCDKFSVNGYFQGIEFRTFFTRFVGKRRYAAESRDG